MTIHGNQNDERSNRYDIDEFGAFFCLFAVSTLQYSFSYISKQIKEKISLDRPRSLAATIMSKEKGNLARHEP
jgi:hypothetical protein